MSGLQVHMCKICELQRKGEISYIFRGLLKLPFNYGNKYATLEQKREAVTLVQ